MHAAIEAKMIDLSAVCARRPVLRLSLFGSGAGDGFDPSSSDIDLLVEFGPLAPAEYADQYFGLLEDLEALFGMAIDLVELAPITNPYLLESIRESQVVLYEAA